MGAVDGMGGAEMGLPFVTGVILGNVGKDDVSCPKSMAEGNTLGGCIVIGGVLL